MLIINRQNAVLQDANIVAEYIIPDETERQKKKGKPSIGNKN